MTMQDQLGLDWLESTETFNPKTVLLLIHLIYLELSFVGSLNNALFPELCLTCAINHVLYILYVYVFLTSLFK